MSLLKRSWFGKLFGGIELILGLGKGYDATNDVRLTSEALRLLLSGQGVAPTEFFDITIDDNTLTGVVSQNVTPHDKWLIKRNDDTAPVSSDMKTGDIDSTVLLPAFGSYTYYLFKEVSGIISEVLNSSGESGVVVSATDTVSPAFPTNALVNLSSELTATEQETQIKFSLIAATDSGSGVVGQSYDLNDLEDDSSFAIDISESTPSIITVGPNFNRTLYGTVDDLSGNSGISNSVTFQTVAAVTGGIASIDDPALFSADDDAGPLQVTLNNTDTVGSPTVTVSTREYDGTNAIAGTRNTFNTNAIAANVITTDAVHGWTSDGLPLVYSKKSGANPPVVNSTAVGLTDHATVYARFTGLTTSELTLHTTAAGAVAGTGIITLTATGSDTQSLFDGNFEPKSSELVTFSSGAATVNIELTELALGSNNMFGLEIDFGSESAGSVGSVASCLCLINSSSTGGTGSIEPTFDGTDYLYVLESNDFDLTRAAQSGLLESFNEATGITAASETSVILSQLTEDWGDKTTLDDDAPFVQWNINFATTDQLFVSVRMKTALVTSQNEVHFNYNETSGGYAASGSALLGLRVLTKDDSLYQGVAYVWDDSTQASARLQFVPAAGEQTFECWGNEPNVTVDKIVLHTSSLYDASVIGDAGEGAFDENYGPLVSSRSSGTIEDNPLNPTVPFSPLPSDTFLPTLSPLDSATGITTSVVFIINALGYTSIESHKFDVFLGSVKISGSVSISGSLVIFFPASPLQVNTEYAIEAVGFGIDNTGTAKSYDTTGVWTITTTLSSDFLLNITFDEPEWATAGLVNAADISPSSNLIPISTDPNTPPQVFKDLFNIWKDYPQYGGIFEDRVRGLDRLMIVPDPSGNPAMGNVLKVCHFVGDKVGGAFFACDLQDDGTADWLTNTYTELNHVSVFDDGSEIDYRGQSTFAGYDELYYSYKMYLAPDYTTSLAQKWHEFISNFIAQSDHADSVDNFSGVLGITNMLHWYRGYPIILPLDAEMSHAASYWYDADKTQRTNFLSKDGVDPTGPDILRDDGYVMPRGRWFEVEVGQKLNTADPSSGLVESVMWGASRPAGSLNDGWVKVWITDPSVGWQRKLVHNIPHPWRRHEDIHLNRWVFRDTLNNTTANPSDLTPVERQAYMKDIRVSKTPFG